jgi:hypothetical protein
VQTDIRQELEEAAANRAACAGAACPIDAEGLSRLARILAEGLTRTGWEETLSAAQGTAACNAACPACDNLMTILNRLTFAGVASDR